MDRKKVRRTFQAFGALLGLVSAFCFVVFILRPPCWILKATGFYCAGCGGQRMVWALLRGDFSGALRQNAFLLFFLPGAVLYALWEACQYIREKPPLYRKKAFFWAALFILVLAVTFTVLRNLPAFRWLAPQ